MMALSLVLIFAGFVLLALAMDRHGKPLRLAVPGAGRRVAAVLFLVLSLWPVMVRYGWAVGVTVWLGMATFAVVLTGLVLTYCPSWLRVCGLVWLANSLTKRKA